MTLPEDKLDRIIDILNQHEKRFDQIDRRFEQIDKRFEQIEKNLEEFKNEIRSEIQEFKTETRENFRDIKYDLRSDKEKLEQVYQTRDKVKITFGWQWGMASLMIAVVASGITQAFA